MSIFNGKNCRSTRNGAVACLRLILSKYTIAKLEMSLVDGISEISAANEFRLIGLSAKTISKHIRQCLSRVSEITSFYTSIAQFLKSHSFRFRLFTE